MSIRKEFDHSEGAYTYTPVCDICGNELFPRSQFNEALHAKKEAGWKSRKVDGEWEDVCEDCLEEEEIDAY